eukprot:TsM_000320600 transcript=TsM_000320600 gene=TsM_000320600
MCDGEMICKNCGVKQHPNLSKMTWKEWQLN